MKFLIVLGVATAALAACSSSSKAPDSSAVVASPQGQTAGEHPVIRLIGMGRHVEDIRLHMPDLKKKFNTQEMRILGSIISLCDEALTQARQAYIAGDFDTFERAIDVIEKGTQEFRSSVQMFNSDREMARAEARYAREQRQADEKARKEKQKTK